MAKIANVALTNTFDTWRSRSNEAFDRLSQFAINNSSLYANTLTANVSFVSKRNAVFAGSTSNTLVRITQNGTGNALVVEDFVVGSTGNVSIGTFSSFGKVSVYGDAVSFSPVLDSTNNGIGACVFGQSVATATTSVARLYMTGYNVDHAGCLDLRAGSVVGSTINMYNTAGTKTVYFNTNSDGYYTGGKFAIGTTSPQAALSIKGSVQGSPTGGDGIHMGATGGYAVQEMAGTTGGYIDFNKGDGVDYRGRVMYTHATDVLSFHTAAGGAGSLTIAGSGLVTVPLNLTVTNRITAGNTTLGGTTTDNSNALSQTLTDGATINWNIALGRVATVTLGGNRTMAAPTNLKVGTYIMTIIQDATGSRTMTWNSVFKWTAGVAPPLTTTANAKDVFSFFSDGTNMFGSFMPDVR